MKEAPDYREYNGSRRRSAPRFAVLLAAATCACLTGVCLVPAATLAAEPSTNSSQPVAVVPLDGAEDVGQNEVPSPRFVLPPRSTTEAADLPPPNVFASVRFSRQGRINPGLDWSIARSTYRPVIEREAKAFGLPPALLDAMMAVESSYNPNVVGFDGEIGLMQVLPSTASMLGFAGTSRELADPEINIHYGAKYLAGAWHLAGQDICTAAMKYRAGHGETRFSVLSVDYCARVRAHLARQGVVVSEPLPQPTFGRPQPARSAGRPTKLSSGSGAIRFAELNATLRALTDNAARHGVR